MKIRGKSTASSNRIWSSFIVIHTLGVLLLHKRGTLAMSGFHGDPGREMGNWYYCCVIIKAPADDDQAVIYYMEQMRATVLPGMNVCLRWRRLKETLSISWLWQIDLVLSLRYFAG